MKHLARALAALGWLGFRMRQQHLYASTETVYYWRERWLFTEVDD